MTKTTLTILIFGTALALLALILQYFGYRYYIGSLGKEIYTAVVAAMFTGIGIWVGIRMFRRKPEVFPEGEIDLDRIEQLKLNDREYEILQLIAKGLSNQEIADKLFLALPTIKTHTSNLYSKLDVKSRTQAVHKARALHLI